MSESELRSDDDIEAILRIAVTQARGIESQTLRERLMASASELGLTPEQVAEAEELWARQERERRDLAEFKAHRRRTFWGHLTTYLIVNAALVAFNVLDEGHVGWAWWPIIGWGIGLALGTAATFLPKSEQFQEEFAKWKQKKADGA